MKFFVWIIAAAALISAIVVVDHASQARPETPEVATIALPTVTFVPLHLRDYRARLTVLSRLEPLYRSEISSLVQGEVRSLGDEFRVGATVAQGDVLATINSSAYEATRAQAAQALAQARLEQSAERREAEQAKQEWQLLERNSGQTASPMYLREPQAAVARLAVEAAQTALHNAIELTAAATIRAPFDATVTAVTLGPGEFVNVGQVIATLVSSNQFEIAAQLTSQQWNLLDLSGTQETVTVVDPVRGTTWSARVRSLGSLLDDRTRLRAVYLSLREDVPTAGAVGGQFVEVLLPGRLLEDVLVLPESAFTRDSAIWTIDDEHRLEKLPVRLIAAEQERVIVERPSASDVYRVVLDPQSRFTLGMSVNPVESVPLVTSTRP